MPLPKLYHGTDVDFRPGDLLLPGTEVGRRNHELSQGVVYLSTDVGIAMVFANDFKRLGMKPKVYEVEPLGEVQKSEPHIEDSHEWTASSGRVIRRIR